MHHRNLAACLILTIGLTAIVTGQDETGFVDLFNGKTLSEWTQRNGTATYSVDGDSIVGRTS